MSTPVTPASDWTAASALPYGPHVAPTPLDEAIDGALGALAEELAENVATGSTPRRRPLSGGAERTSVRIVTVLTLICTLLALYDLARLALGAS